MIFRGIFVALLAGAAHAGTVTTVTFNDVPSTDVVIANGVEARSSAGFVVYQHGVWTRPVSSIAEPVPASTIAAAANPIAGTSCTLVAPAPRRSLAAETSADRAAYWPLIRDAECRHALPAGLLDAVVFQESRYRPSAVSRAGASGLTQLMPRTAIGLGVSNRFDPAANIDGGARYLRSMLDHYRSVPLAVAAYNAGRGSVDRWRGIPLNRETPGYVQKVLAFFNEVDDGYSQPPFARPVILPRVVSLTFGAPGID
ncbi:MAG: lytic transglycosylase domain-containing protein [Janthinobacterium lividum]